jgi:hypothetical protein
MLADPGNDYLVLDPGDGEDAFSVQLPTARTRRNGSTSMRGRRYTLPM